MDSIGIKEINETHNMLKSFNYPVKHFESNIKTLKFEYTDLIDEDNALYSPKNNTIYYKEITEDKIKHELIHLASTERSEEEFYKQNKKFYRGPGLCLYDDEKNMYGLSLNEGLTEYIRMHLYENDSLDKSKFSCEEYYFSALFARVLLKLLDEKTILDLYFDNNPKEFYKYLSSMLSPLSGYLIEKSDDILLSSKDFILNAFRKLDKIQLNNNLINLSYKYLKNKDIDDILVEHINLYFDDDPMSSTLVHNNLNKVRTKKVF